MTYKAVAVHCAEGRGRTGVMCACYLIYYYDMEPWDAIRIMRRQRPGSVERKVQEETVVRCSNKLTAISRGMWSCICLFVPPFLRSPARFYQLLADYGKGSVDKLDQREKQLIEMQKRQQAELMRCEQQVLKFISNNRLQLVAVNAFNLQDKP